MNSYWNFKFPKFQKSALLKRPSTYFFALRKPKLVFRFFAGKLVTEIEVEELVSILGNDGVIIEAGAYDGTDTIEFAKFFPETLIHAVEPLKAAFEYLTTRISNSNIRLHNVALSDRVGKQLLFESKAPNHNFSGSSSLSLPKLHLEEWPEITFNLGTPVDTIDLSTFVAKNNISYIKLLKLDVQGYELKILTASPDILDICGAIQLEVSRKELYENCATHSEIKNFLKNRGFKLLIDRIGPRDGNVLYVRSNLI
jgi:FkbM family methyltransferase